MKRSWSLAGRLTRLVAVTTTGIVVTVIAVSVALLRGSVERELRALLVEEFAELDAVLAPDAEPGEFVRTADRLDRMHPANPLAWRAWNPDGSPFGEHDPHGLLERVALDAGHLDTHAQATHAVEDLRWRIDMLASGLTVAIVADGEAQLAAIGKFGSLALALALGATVVVVGIGSALCLRSARGLSRIAENLRSLEAVDARGPLEVEDAPNEIRAVAEALGQMLRNLRRDRDEARLLTAGLAHELRSPLQNLLGEAEVALLRERTPAEYQRTLQSQLEELDDLRRVVDNLVVLSSPREPTSGELEAFDLAEEIELRSQRERKVAARGRVDLSIETRGDVVLEGDREVLLLAVSNLMANAIRYTPPGGRVHILVDGTTDDVVVTVDDAGPGVAPEDRERIFDTFFQGQRQGPGRIGYGLGLALARRAVEIHHGRIEVGDGPQGGARFRIVVPRGGRGAGSRPVRAQPA